MRLFRLRAALLMVAALISGCAGPRVSPPSPPVSASSAPPPVPASAEAAGLKAPGVATIGDRTICPTSGEEFTVTSASPKVEYQGRTYYFCCGGCDAKFAQDPQKYLRKKPDA